MNNLAKIAFVISAIIGFAMGSAHTANAADANAGYAGVSAGGLAGYAGAPLIADNKDVAKTFQLADYRGYRHRHRKKRKKRDIGGKIAAGVAIGIAGIILSEAIRDSRRKRRYDDRYYTYDNDYYEYDGYDRRCRRWARRCDRGVRRACRRWVRNCE